MKDELIVLQSPRRQGTGEDIPWAFDFAPQLLEGEFTAAPLTSEIVDMDDFQQVPTALDGAPTTDGISKVIQAVYNLEAGHKYRLAVSATVGAKTLKAALFLDCPF